MLRQHENSIDDKRQFIALMKDLFRSKQRISI